MRYPNPLYTVLLHQQTFEYGLRIAPELFITKGFSLKVTISGLETNQSNRNRIPQGIGKLNMRLCTPLSNSLWISADVCSGELVANVNGIGESYSHTPLFHYRAYAAYIKIGVLNFW